MWRNNWFLLSLVVSVGLGLSLSEPLAQLGSASRLQTTIVFVVMWMMAAPVPLELVTRTLARPFPGLLAAAVNLGVLPLLALAVSSLLTPELGGGLLVVATVPSTLASAAVWTRKAGGDDTVAIFVTLLTNLGCVVVTPLWLVALLGVRVQLDLVDLMQSLAVIMILPILLAQAMRRSAKFCRAIERSKMRLAVGCQLGILLMVFLGSIRMGQGLQPDADGTPSAVGLGQIASVILLAAAVHVAALGIAWWLAGLCGIARPQQIAVALSGSQKTLMIGLKLAIDCGVSILPMVVYHVSQLVIDAAIVQRLSRGGVASGTDGDNPG